MTIGWLRVQLVTTLKLNDMTGNRGKIFQKARERLVLTLVIYSAKNGLNDHGIYTLVGVTTINHD